MEDTLNRLPCGVDIHVQGPYHQAGVYVVRLTNNSEAASWHEFKNENTPDQLALYIKSENLPILAKIISGYLPKPTFFDKLKNLFSGE